MAITTIPWGDGSGDNIYLSAPSQTGDQSVSVTSDPNTGAARSKVVTFSAVGVTPVSLTINQAAGGGGGNISNYVQDGLVLLLDGIDKGNVSGAWTDLIGGKSFTNHGATFNDDNVQFDGTDDYLDITAFSVPTSASGTIEVVMDIDAISGKHFPVFKPTTSGGIMFFWASGGYIIWSYTSGNRARPKPTIKKGSWSLSNAGRYLQNGVQMSTMSGTSLAGSNGMYIGRRLNDYGKGKIYSIRIYNRQLTLAEVQQNLAVDNIRFNLGLTL